MNVLKSLSICVCVIFIAGCSAVYSSKPIGEKAVSISAEDWEGTWIHKEGSVTIRVVDKEKGLLQVAWVEEKQYKLKLESYNVHLLDSGELLFGSPQDKDDPKLYLWGRVKKDDGQIIVWTPDVSKIKSLVGEGVLPATVDKDGNVVLADLTAEHLKLITSSDKGVIVEWEEPIVFLRLSK